MTQVAERVRGAAERAIFLRVAGPDATATRARIHETPGPRWFPAGSAVQRVHGDASMFVGGLRALLLQSLHPLAMAGVAAHSGYRGDPWGRLQRTSTFIATTTFGTADDAAGAVAAVRAVHERVRGVAPDGRPYRASDPDLLRWVHVAETQSFLVAHQEVGHRPLDAAGCDEYVAQAAWSAAPWASRTCRSRCASWTTPSPGTGRCSAHPGSARRRAVPPRRAAAAVGRASGVRGARGGRAGVPAGLGARGHAARAGTAPAVGPPGGGDGHEAAAVGAPRGLTARRARRVRRRRGGDGRRRGRR
nr:oxygenase MpaB family protein [Cellulosimicrobium sp. MM]